MILRLKVGLKDTAHLKGDPLNPEFKLYCDAIMNRSTPVFFERVQYLVV
jgi:hypothetical protein